MKGEPYRDRWEAGRAVADQLSAYRDLPGVLVLGLPRGGLPVAAEVAQTLNAPLDVLIVRKIGMPSHPEFAMGAIAAIANHTVILVDDGLATGSTMRAAIAVVKQEHPAKLIAAVPVGSHEACGEIRELVDEFVCPWTPEPFWAVGQGYESFQQTTDDEVREILRSASGAGDE